MSRRSFATGAHPMSRRRKMPMILNLPLRQANLMSSRCNCLNFRRKKMTTRLMTKIQMMIRLTPMTTKPEPLLLHRKQPTMKLTPPTNLPRRQASLMNLMNFQLDNLKNLPQRQASFTNLTPTKPKFHSPALAPKLL